MSIFYLTMVGVLVAFITFILTLVLAESFLSLIDD
jgi:hypothetical protein